MIPKTWFSTPLSKSAKDTERRIRNIFEGQRHRPTVIVLALVAAVALLCGSVVAVRTKRTVPTMEDRWEREKKEAVAAYAAAADGSAELPAYVYQGDNPYLAAVCDWITSGEGRKYLQAEVTIPCPLIAEIDDSDPNNVLIWGDFSIHNYKAVGTTLLTVSGGFQPGLLHLRPASGGYEVYDAELVEDGERYADSMDRIFGWNRRIKLDAVNAAEVRAQSIADYVLQNGLPFTQYQDFGWDPVHIPGTPETPEAAQIIHLVSPMGWSIDYDLREFSHDIAYGELETLFGVGRLQGVSIYFEFYKETDAQVVIQEWVRQNTKPEIEDTTVGVEGVHATKLRDGTTRDEVIKDTYVITLNGRDTLAVSVRNTYYAEPGDPVVPGADAALAKTLATFQLTQRSTEELALEFVDRDGFLNALQKAKSIRYTTPRIRSDNYPIAITDEELLADLKGRLSLVKEATEVAPHLENDGEGFYLDESNVLFCVCEGYLFALRQYPDGNSVSALIGEAPEHLPYDLYIAAHKQDAISNDTRLSFAGEVTGYGNDTLLVQVTDAKGSNLRVGEKVYVPVAEGYENYPRGTEVEAEYNGVVEMDDEGLLGLDKVYSLRRIG